MHKGLYNLKNETLIRGSSFCHQQLSADKVWPNLRLGFFLADQTKVEK